MAQLYVAHYLEELLRFWEDCNISGEFNFQLSLFTREKNGVSFDEKYDAKVGTELNNLGLFARGIPDFKKLRKVLMGDNYHHPTSFMPRVPKDVRSIVGSKTDLFYDHFFVKSPILIPKFLLNWNNTRRACVLSDEIPLPLVDLRNENWFDKLPYRAFFLKLATPFFFPDSDMDSGGWSVDSFLIYQDDSHIRILSWPKEIDRSIHSEEDRNDIEKETQQIKKGKKPKAKTVQNVAKVHDWFLIHVAIRTGTSSVLAVDLNESGIEEEYIDLYNQDFWKKQYRRPDWYNLIKLQIETVNGFCKLMSQLPPASSVESIGHLVLNKKAQVPRLWFELPLQTVDYFHTESSDNKVVIKRGTGSEKSPHIRRGHTRRIVQKDGTVRELWIDQITVRQDKLTTEQLQGGALKVQ